MRNQSIRLALAIGMACSVFPKPLHTLAPGTQRNESPPILSDSLNRRTTLPGHLGIDRHVRVEEAWRAPARARDDVGTARTQPISVCSSGAVDTAWVRHYASGLVPSEDYAIDLAVDQLGNVYVTGSSSAGIFAGQDYCTIKYDMSGEVVWSRRYNGPGERDDVPAAIVVDKLGNVYVTGESWGVGTSLDYATIKYNADGEELWVRRYDGPRSDEEYAHAIAVDKSGNVYVTGSSIGSGTYYDYATIKYSTTGDEVWVRRYDGPEHSSDGAHSIAVVETVDSTGSVYVTGGSWGSDTEFDFATIKYSSSGDEIWVKRYNGPDSKTDYAIALVLDEDGNVLVAGNSETTSPWGDGLTIKYSSLGEEVWVKRYSGILPHALAIDDIGNVYLTGECRGEGHTDYETIKYSAKGGELWVRRYDAGEFGGAAYSLAVDAVGQVYVTGSSWSSRTQLEDYATIKYSSSGDVIWARRYNPPANSSDHGIAIAVDACGNCYVTGRSWGSGTNGDYATLKYSPAGDEVWVRRYNGPGKSIEVPRAFAVDAEGNTFVAGGSSGDYATVGYDTRGHELWVKRYNGAGDNYDEAVAVAVDATGNIYVAGESYSPATLLDFVTIKYNARGDELWVRRYTGPDGSEDVVTSMAVDVNGDVYVTGRSNADYATVKYSSQGDEVWVRRYNGPGNVDDAPTALAVDGDGNVYVTGITDIVYAYWVGIVDGDYATVKYDPNGREVWVRRYNGPGDSLDYARALAIDAKGNAHVTGNSYGSKSGADYATIKYDSSGNEVWVRRCNGPENSYDVATSVALDAGGNVYVTGRSNQGATGDDYLTVKYSSAGNEIWKQRYDGSNSSYDVAVALAVDDGGNAIVTGSSEGTIVTLQYSGSGSEDWRTQYVSGNATWDSPVGIGIDAAGGVYVAGVCAGIESDQRVYTTIKYNRQTTAVENSASEIPAKYLLEQNYPNPFNPSTTIKYELPQSLIVRLSVYDMLGREVSVLVNERMDAGVHEVKFDGSGLSSGVYFYRLRAGDFVETRKLLLVR